MNNYCENMDIAKALDFAIRDYELLSKSNGYSPGYFINKQREYWNYLSKDSWEAFMKAMTSEHKKQYLDGGGGELDERNSRWGILPPKMASFGSSSRMIYMYSKDTPGFMFEKQMPTHVGHDANLDGYLLHDNKAVFVEAKCREIYASHTNLDISNVYKEVYDYLHEKEQSFSYIKTNGKDPNYFKCTFHYDNLIIKHFDIKQLICHFLGITADLIKNKHAHNNVVFVYFIFNPEINTDFSNPAIFSYGDQIKTQYEETIAEIAKFGDMKWLFDSIMRYQTNNLKLPIANYSFDFKLADQDEYKKYLIEISAQKLLRS